VLTLIAMILVFAAHRGDTLVQFLALIIALATVGMIAFILRIRYGSRGRDRSSSGT
jgi:hypothetical protein